MYDIYIVNNYLVQPFSLHLKIVNERTSVAFDDIICLLTPWNTRLSNQTNIMLHFQDLLKKRLNL